VTEVRQAVRFAVNAAMMVDAVCLATFKCFSGPTESSVSAVQGSPQKEQRQTTLSTKGGSQVITVIRATMVTASPQTRERDDSSL
jgi:hypothetical protein